ncbi:AzlC family ABC transporter permease [Oxobacter pfennigii]|uniref:AzlC family ABC transporter permease n=1 Tax=Oxobacter pfennigii TaxID=36849 RepID=UPI0006D3ACEB|nr:AzlC family ABC transporter permease [Oxobacter pfennigii]
MNKHFKIHQGLKEGTSSAIPLVIGFIPIAMTFGILAKATGVTILECFMFSAMVFAGASQFMALNLLAIGAGMGEIILTTLLLNFRHFLMGASIAARLNDRMKRWIPFIAFTLTDESFSVLSFKEGEISKEFILTLQYLSYASWVGGSVLGYMLGEAIPPDIRASMGVGLYAMFAAILVPQAKKNKEAMILACMSAAINFIFSLFKIFPNGWSIMASICLVSLAGLFIFKEEKKEVINAYEQ